MGLNMHALAARIKKRRADLPGIEATDASDEGRGRLALVTGASSGIGKAFTELLAAKGYDVVVVARRETLLKELRGDLEARWGVRIHPVTCDLGDPDAITHLLGELERLGLAVDFLVNNAGYVLSGSYLDNPWDDHLKMVRVMGVSVAELTHRLLPHMVQQRWGRVVNIASIGATFAGSPGQTLYSATKSFVHKFSEALAAEYEEYGVYSTVGLPGATDTGLMNDIQEYADNSLFFQLTMMRSEAVARQCYQAVMQRRRVIVNGVPNKLWAVAQVHSPRPVRYAMVKFTAAMNPAVQEKKRAASSAARSAQS